MLIPKYLRIHNWRMQIIERKMYDIKKMFVASKWREIVRMELRMGYHTVTCDMKTANSEIVVISQMKARCSTHRKEER